MPKKPAAKSASRARSPDTSVKPAKPKPARSPSASPKKKAPSKSPAPSGEGAAPNLKPKRGSRARAVPEVQPAPAAPVAPASGGPSDPALVRAFAIEAARLLSDDKCTDVLVLDVSSLSPVSDMIVLGTGTSDRQMRSVLDHVREMGESRGFPAFRTSRDERATWLLADFVDVVVHLFEPAARDHYDLETLWGDAPRVDWSRPEPPARAPRRKPGAGGGGGAGPSS